MQREGDSSQKSQIPAELERNYQLTITPGEFEKKNIVKMRDIKASQIGSLVTMKGIVTRATDVRPCIKVAVFACDACGSEVYQLVNSKEFNPQVECPSQKCIKNQVKG
jgi:DNA replication licensing factor MCM7